MNKGLEGSECGFVYLYHNWNLDWGNKGALGSVGIERINWSSNGLSINSAGILELKDKIKSYGKP